MGIFELGRVVGTPAAIEAIEAAGDEPATFLDRHASGDWGDIPKEDRGINEQALTHGNRIMSVYKTSAGVTLWIVTERDRSATTILLPEEY